MRLFGKRATREESRVDPVGVNPNIRALSAPQSATSCDDDDNLDFLDGLAPDDDDLFQPAPKTQVSQVASLQDNNEDSENERRRREALANQDITHHNAVQPLKNEISATKPVSSQTVSLGIHLESGSTPKKEPTGEGSILSELDSLFSTEKSLSLKPSSGSTRHILDSSSTGTPLRTSAANKPLKGGSSHGTAAPVKQGWGSSHGSNVMIDDHSNHSEAGRMGRLGNFFRNTLHGENREGSVAGGSQHNGGGSKHGMSKVATDEVQRRTAFNEATLAPSKINSLSGGKDNGSTTDKHESKGFLGVGELKSANDDAEDAFASIFASSASLADESTNVTASTTAKAKAMSLLQPKTSRGKASTGSNQQSQSTIEKLTAELDEVNINYSNLARAMSKVREEKMAVEKELRVSSIEIDDLEEQMQHMKSVNNQIVETMRAEVLTMTEERKMSDEAYKAQIVSLAQDKDMHEREIMEQMGELNREMAHMVEDHKEAIQAKSMTIASLEMALDNSRDGGGGTTGRFQAMMSATSRDENDDNADGTRAVPFNAGQEESRDKKADEENNKRMIEAVSAKQKEKEQKKQIKKLVNKVRDLKEQREALDETYGNEMNEKDIIIQNFEEDVDHLQSVLEQMEESNENFENALRKCQEDLDDAREENRLLREGEEEKNSPQRYNSITTNESPSAGPSSGGNTANMLLELSKMDAQDTVSNLERVAFLQARAESSLENVQRVVAKMGLDHAVNSNRGGGSVPAADNDNRTRDDNDTIRSVLRTSKLIEEQVKLSLEFFELKFMNRLHTLEEDGIMLSEGQDIEEHHASAAAVVIKSAQIRNEAKAGIESLGEDLMEEISRLTQDVKSREDALTVMKNVVGGKEREAAMLRSELENRPTATAAPSVYAKQEQQSACMTMNKQGELLMPVSRSVMEALQKEVIAVVDRVKLKDQAIDELSVSLKKSKINEAKLQDRIKKLKQ